MLKTIRMMIVMFAALLPLGTLASGTHVASPADAWLVGNWLHTYDPDGDPPDRLTFSEDGKFVTTEISSNRSIEGQYVVAAHTIKVSLMQQGKVFMKLDLTFDDKKDKLYYKSQSTGSTSYYTKTKSGK